MEHQNDQFDTYIANKLLTFEKRLAEINHLEVNPLKPLIDELVRDKKEVLNQIQLFSQMKQHYQNFLSTQEEQIYERISKTLLLGPIAMFKPAIFKSKLRVQRLRQVYQLLLGSNEQINNVRSENFVNNVSFAQEFVDDNIKNLKSAIQSESLGKDLQFLYTKAEKITKDEWMSLLGQVVDLPTIQEINQTNIDFDLQYSGGSESLNQQDSENSPKEKKGQFNYDGDEEKTPLQSEQEDDNKIIAPWRKTQEQDLDKEEQLDSAGYEASNSDTSKKPGKCPRIPRSKKKIPGQDFDTDRERERNKK